VLLPTTGTSAVDAESDGEASADAGAAADVDAEAAGELTAAEDAARVGLVPAPACCCGELPPPLALKPR
jgi:hypothetical protein